MTRDGLSLAEARRVALAAQGLTDPRPTGRVDRRHVHRVLRRVGLLQVDSVNVVARAHYLPVFSRVGPYPTELLDRLAYPPGRRGGRLLFEYWGHEASLLPVTLQPLLRWRMARAASEAWGSVARMARHRPDYVAQVLAAVSERGPLRAGDLEPPKRSRRGQWWDRSDAKRALEWLFWSGRLSVARRVNFERHYDLTERVLPAAVLAAPTPPPDEAQRGLLRVAAAALGVATAGDLADYFRLRVPEARPRIAELVEAGDLRPVTVQGWRQPAYLHPRVRLPRTVNAQALLAPFDPLVWERQRVERLFGFHYRIEIYTPTPRRRWGYYVLPFLLGDRLAARVDLKADRRAGLLRALGAWVEEHAAPATVAPSLAAELASLADWLGLGGVAVADRGDLAAALRRLPAGSGRHR